MKDRKNMVGMMDSKVRQVYSYSTFKTQRQLSVFYINTSKRNIQRKDKDKVKK